MEYDTFQIILHETTEIIPQSGTDRNTHSKKRSSRNLLSEATHKIVGHFVWLTWLRHAHKSTNITRF